MWFGFVLNTEFFFFFFFCIFKVKTSNTPLRILVNNANSNRIYVPPPLPRFLTHDETYLHYSQQGRRTDPVLHSSVI